MTSYDALALMLTALAPVISGALIKVCMSLWSKFNKQATAEDRELMEREINAAIGAGMALVPSVVRDGVVTPAAREDILTAAATYFRQRFPDRTAQIADAAGTGNRSDDVHTAVKQTIAARLPSVNSVAALLPGPGGGQDGATISPAPTLPATPL